MQLVRLACAMGIILVSGGCAGRAAPPPADPSPVAPAAAERWARLHPVEVRYDDGETLTIPAPAVSAPFVFRHRYDCPCYPVSYFIVDGTPLTPEEFTVAGIARESIEDLLIARTPGPQGEAVILIRTQRR